MNAPYLILGLLCGLAIGYAFGWQYGQRLRKWNAAQEAQITEQARRAPHVLMRPRMFPDGNAWCALYGENIQEGIVGFGETPEAAAADFDIAWRKQKNKVAASDAFDRKDVEAVADCLGDDATQLRKENHEDERADNMDRAASMLTWMLLTHPAYAGGVQRTGGNDGR